MYDDNEDLLDVLPTDNAEDLVDYLVEVGIFRERTERRLAFLTYFSPALG
jgi:hypothetical protein